MLARLLARHVHVAELAAAQGPADVEVLQLPAPAGRLLRGADSAHAAQRLRPRRRLSWDLCHKGCSGLVKQQSWLWAEPHHTACHGQRRLVLALVWRRAQPFCRRPLHGLWASPSLVLCRCPGPLVLLQCTERQARILTTSASPARRLFARPHLVQGCSGPCWESRHGLGHRLGQTASRQATSLWPEASWSLRPRVSRAVSVCGLLFCATTQGPHRKPFRSCGPSANRFCPARAGI